MDEKKLLKSGEAAKFLGVSQRAVAYWVKSGILIPDEIRKNNYRDYSYFYEETLQKCAKKLLEIKGSQKNVRLKSKVRKSGQKSAQLKSKVRKSGQKNVRLKSKVRKSGQKRTIEVKSAQKVEQSSDTALVVIEEKNVSIFPSRKHIEPNDKLTEKLFSMSADTYEKILIDGNTFYLIEVKNHKKFGDILSPLCIKLINGYLDKTPMDQFDRFVLAACISEWVKENNYTTPNIIYRHLTGKTGSDSEAPEETKEEILQSIRRLMCTEITINMTDYCTKLGCNDGKPFELTSTMLPCSYAKGIIVNGQPSTVIKILDEPPLLKIARLKAQLLTYDEKLLDVPHQHNSIDIIAIKNYVMQRVQEIIKHNLTPIIRFDDVFEKCGLIDIRNNKKMRMRKVITELMERIKSNGEIVAYTINKEKNKFSSISIQYQSK